MSKTLFGLKFLLKAWDRTDICNCLVSCLNMCALSFGIILSTADKPPIEELRHFLDFQLPRIWAPVYGELPLGPKLQSDAYLQFSFLGSKLYVNTTRVSNATC